MSGLAVAGVALVQENGPEQVEIKRSIYAELDRLAPPDAILASSSSAIRTSRNPSAMFCSDSFPYPRMSRKTFCSEPDNLSKSPIASSVRFQGRAPCTIGSGTAKFLHAASLVSFQESPLRFAKETTLFAPLTKKLT